MARASPNVALELIALPTNIRHGLTYLPRKTILAEWPVTQIKSFITSTPGPLL